MTMVGLEREVPTAEWGDGSVMDFVVLLKPRVMSLVVFTALTGMACAPGHLHPVLAAIALLCIATGAGASGALNMWYDADIDARMSRTAGRPLPRGRISRGEALGFGLVLAAASVIILGLLVDLLAAALLLLTIVYYVVVYTMWLKRRTAQNIVIGGAAGALPPVIGWAAVTGSVSLDPVLLFLIVFFWTPPHFWALALNRKRDFERAGLPMLPNVAGEKETRRQILLYTLVLVPLAVSPVATGLGGIAYAAVSIVLGAAFLALAVAVYRGEAGEASAKTARRLFSFSILYLFLLFATLLGERVVPLMLGR